VIGENKFRHGALALGFMAAAAPAVGQQAVSLTSAPTDRRTQVSFSMDALYDSNVARSDAALAAERRLTLADEIFTPGGHFIVSRNLGREILFLQGDAEYNFHRTNTILDRENVDVAAGVNGRLGRCRVLPSAEYSRAQSDLAEQSLTAVKNVLEVETIGISADCGRATGLAPTFSASQVWRGNSAVQSRSVDSNTTGVSAGIAYRRPVLGSISLFGSYAAAEFPHRPNRIGPGAGNFGYELYSSGLTYERRVGRRIEGAVTVSYSQLNPNTVLSPAFSGVTYAFDGAYHPTSRVALHLSANRAPAPSNRVNSDYSIDTTYEADLSYLMGSKVTLSLTGLEKSEIYHITPGAVQIDLTRETADSVSAAATYRLTRRLSVAANLSYQDRRANFPGLSYTDVRSGVQVKFTY
jgi:hypothetical protein